MRFKCLARELTEEEHKHNDASPLFRPRYQITVDNIYLVLGIEFFVKSPIYGNCCLFTIADDAGKCISVPSTLGEITDGRVSRYWLARSNEEFNMILWPEEFFLKFFHDRLSDGERDAVDIFKTVICRLESEF